MRRFLIAVLLCSGMLLAVAPAPSMAQGDQSGGGGSSGAPLGAVAPPSQLAGRYSIRGTNPNGSTYGGVVVITQSGGTYNFRWRIANGDIYNGRGTLRGRTLTVDWGQQDPVIYQVGDDGTLRGKWANGRASEDLLPER